MLAADKGDPAVPLGQQIRRGNRAGVGIAVVNPADLAFKIGHSQHDMGKMPPGQYSGQRMGHNADMDGNGIGTAAGDDFLCRAAGGGFVRSLQDQMVASFLQRLLQPGNDFKHMGIPEGRVGRHIRQKHHQAIGAAGKILGIGTGIVVQFPHHLPHMLRCLFRDAVVAVEHLGNRGNGYARCLRHILNGYAHGKSPPFLLV